MPKRVNTTAPLHYADQDLEKMACSIRAVRAEDGFGRFADYVLCMAVNDQETSELVLMADESQE